MVIGMLLADCLRSVRSFVGVLWFHESMNLRLVKLPCSVLGASLGAPSHPFMLAVHASTQLPADGLAME